MRSTGARAALGLLLAAVLALGAPAATGQPTDRGFFLVAKPSIVDPTFQRTVVLVANAPDGATLGVIINRPTQQSLASILPGNPTLAKFTEPLYFGGPVERVGLFAVFRAKEAPAQSLHAGDDVHLALHPPTVEQLLLKPPEHLRFFNGYSGWAPGQLANELQRGDWWVFEADADTVFRKDTSTIWEELARRARSITAQADHPPMTGRSRAAGSRAPGPPAVSGRPGPQ
ncbi:MAG TPA: YqgE/AlgH family protein [Burkholderiales bacterium]|nr:YqgE/AlgH family protein [Burkholderiales bacterium]